MGVRALGAFMVAPGEYTGFKGSMRMKSGRVMRVMMNDLSMTIFGTYVPFRLCMGDTEWEDFMSGETDALPWGNVAAFPGIFEGGTAWRSLLMRRAFKLAYNHHFGDETVGSANGAWYDDPMADAVVTEMRVRSYEQNAVSGVLTTEADQDTYLAPVAGATATISLGDMMRAMRNSRASERRALAGDKYVDQMKRFGINLGDSLHQQPLGLGGKSVSLKPKTRDFDYALIAAGYSGMTTWEGETSFSLPARKFTEHGVVIIMGAVRHPSFVYGLLNRSLWFQGSLQDRNGLYDPDADEEGGSVSAPLYAKNSAIVGGQFHDTRFPHYLKGEHSVGSHTSIAQYWATVSTVGTPAQHMYPVSAFSLADAQVFVVAKMTAVRKTPVR
ncbi:TPA_asm: major capsid protein [Microviridae sp.]|nr:TPA_asm: major capsid protein [Microviridae sp.]